MGERQKTFSLVSSLATGGSTCQVPSSEASEISLRFKAKWTRRTDTTRTDWRWPRTWLAYAEQCVGRTTRTVSVSPRRPSWKLWKTLPRGRPRTAQGCQMTFSSCVVMECWTFFMTIPAYVWSWMTSGDTQGTTGRGPPSWRSLRNQSTSSGTGGRLFPTMCWTTWYSTSSRPASSPRSRRFRRNTSSGSLRAFP